MSTLTATVDGDPGPPRPDGALPRGGATISERPDALPATIDVKAPKPKADRRPYYAVGGLMPIRLISALGLGRPGAERAETARSAPLPPWTRVPSAMAPRRQPATPRGRALRALASPRSKWRTTSRFAAVQLRAYAH